MSWNYRVVKRVFTYMEKKEIQYAIYEVYYGKKEEIKAISEEPVFPVGETLEELNRALIDYYTCYNKPYLIYEDIEGE